MAEPIDWLKLKGQFMVSERVKAYTFYTKDLGWSNSKASGMTATSNGNSWEEEKAKISQRNNDIAMAEVNKIERERLASYKRSKLNSVATLIERLNQTEPIVKTFKKGGKIVEYVIYPPDTKEIAEIYKTLKIELGEVTVFTKNENNNTDTRKFTPEEIQADIKKIQDEHRRPTTNNKKVRK